MSEVMNEPLTQEQFWLIIGGAIFAWAAVTIFWWLCEIVSSKRRK